MSIKHQDRHHTNLGPPLCGTDQLEHAYDFLVRNHAAGRLRPVEGISGDLVGIYASILGLDKQHAMAKGQMVIKQKDGTEILLRPTRIQ